MLSRFLKAGLNNCLLALVLLQWNSLSARADILFTDRAAFEAGLPSGFFIDTFASAQDAVSAPAPSYSNSGGTPTIGYSITAPSGGLFIGQRVDLPGTKLLGPWEVWRPKINFHSPDVFPSGNGHRSRDIEPVTRCND